MSTLAHYKLNGDAADASGNGRNGTPTNISWVAGKIGQAASLNGSSSRIAVAADFPANHQGDLSIALWVNLADKNATQNLVSKYASGYWEYQVSAADGGNYFTLLWYHKNAVQDLINASTQIAYGGWRHVVAVRDSAQSKIAFYIDGVLDASGWQAYNPAYIANLGGNALMLGTRGDGAAGFTQGTFDDVRFFDEALPAWKIAAIYNGGIGTEELQPWQKQYRFDEGQSSCAGAVAGNFFPAGASAGQDFHSGTVAGQG